MRIRKLPTRWSFEVRSRYTVRMMPRDLGRSADASGRAGGPEASIDVKARSIEVIAAGDERVAEHHARRPEAEVDLPSVGVAAELESDLAGGAREELRIVAKEDPREIGRDGGDGAIEIRPRRSRIGPRTEDVVDAEQREARAGVADHPAVVDQHRRAGAGDRGAHGVEAGVVVVVAGDGDDAVARERAEAAHEAAERVGVARIVIDEIAREDDQIGARALDEILGGAELGLAHEGAEVEVRELDDGVPVEAPREAGDARGDLFERVVVAADQGAVERAAHAHEHRRSGGRLGEEGAARDVGERRGGGLGGDFGRRRGLRDRHGRGRDQAQRAPRDRGDEQREIDRPRGSPRRRSR